MKLLEKIKIISPQLLIDQSLKTQLNPTNIKLMKLGQCNNLCWYVNEVNVDMQNKYRLTCELRMCWQTKKVYIDIRNKYYHNNETENYNARVKKNFKHAPLLDFTDTKNPVRMKIPAFLCHPCVMFFVITSAPLSAHEHIPPLSATAQITCVQTPCKTLVSPVHDIQWTISYCSLKPVLLFNTFINII